MLTIFAKVYTQNNIDIFNLMRGDIFYEAYGPIYNKTARESALLKLRYRTSYNKGTELSSWKEL